MLNKSLTDTNYSLTEETTISEEILTKETTISEEVLTEKSTISEKILTEESRNFCAKRKKPSPLIIRIPDNQLSPPLEKSPSALTQTSHILSANSPRKEKLRTKLKKLQRINSILKAKLKRKNKLEDVTETDFLKLCNKFLPKNIQFFITEQIKLQKCHKKGYRYTKEFKRYALSLFFISPSAYRFLQKIYHLSDVCKDLSKTG